VNSSEKEEVLKAIAIGIVWKNRETFAGADELVAFEGLSHYFLWN